MDNKKHKIKPICKEHCKERGRKFEETVRRVAKLKGLISTAKKDVAMLTTDPGDPRSFDAQRALPH